MSMSESNKLQKPCSTRKRKFKTINGEEEESTCLIRSDERKAITPSIEESVDEEKVIVKNIDDDDGGGGGACKMIRDGCDFLCAEELGQKFLLCGGRYSTDNKLLIPRKQVSIKKALRKKSVAVLFAKVGGYGELSFHRSLSEVYHQLKHERGAAFEIVFVPSFPYNTDDIESEDLFNAQLNLMPWLAVPFHDSTKWRKHIINRYSYESEVHRYNLTFFDPNGGPLGHYGGMQKLINFFGPDFYPFTEAKKKELLTKYFAPTQSPNKSLAALLGGSNRDFLISYGDGDGDGLCKRVPISKLHGRVVGIYFYRIERGKHYNRNLMRKLQEIRLRAISERRGNFEVVFINVDFEEGYSSERAFNCFLKKWPWLLALPFKDEKIRALRYTLAIGDCVNPLTIISAGVGDDDFYIDPEGYNIIEEYGFDAYPFTRDAAVVTARDRLTQLHLTDFFNASGIEFLRSPLKEKHNEPVSFVQNKKVLLYIANCRSDQEISKLLDLQKKEKNSFQVLFFAPWWRKSASPNPMLKTWFAVPRSVYLWELITKIVKFDFDTSLVELSNYFIAFNETGKVLRFGDMELLTEDSVAAFPFITDETFDNEFREWMIGLKEWDSEIGDKIKS